MLDDREPLLVVRYGGSFVWIQIVVGIVALLWSPVLASLVLHQPTVVVGPITIVGAIMLLGGLLMARGSPFVTVESPGSAGTRSSADGAAQAIDGCFVKHALVGPLKRRFPFASWGEVSCGGGRVRVAGKKLPFSRTGARGEDWAALEALVAEKRR